MIMLRNCTKYSDQVENDARLVYKMGTGSRLVSGFCRAPLVFEQIESLCFSPLFIYFCIVSVLTRAKFFWSCAESGFPVETVP